MVKNLIDLVLIKNCPASLVHNNNLTEGESIHEEDIVVKYIDGEPVAVTCSQYVENHEVGESGICLLRRHEDDPCYYSFMKPFVKF
jgi:hypothetical protein